MLLLVGDGWRGEEARSGGIDLDIGVGGAVVGMYQWWAECRMKMRRVYRRVVDVEVVER